MADTIIATNVVKRYGTLTAVDDVSLSVGHGEFFGILGPNGAGKTTLLEIIEGLRQADSGDVTVLGERVWPRNPKLLNKIGVQLQASAFFERLTAKEQLETFGALYGTSSQRITEMLEMVVLDEPSAALDPQARRNLWDVLRAINERGKTVVLTTHYMDEAESLCDRVAIMDAGKVLQLGPPAVLVRGLGAPVRIAVEAGALGQDRARVIEGAESVSGDGVSTVITTRRPAPVLQALAGMDALAGLQVRGA